MTGSSLTSHRAEIALALVAVLLAGTGGLVVWLRQAPSVVTLDDAVAQFRDASPQPTPQPDAAPGGQAGAAESDTGASAPTASGAPAAPTPGSPPAAAPAPGPAPSAGPAVPGPGSRLPDEGVYSFATEGGGETNALGGARHDYPAEVPVIVRKGGCGYTVRWQPLNERWDEWEFCPGSGAQAGSRPMLRISTYHEFFQRGQRQDFACNRPEMLPATLPPGSQQHWNCSSGSATVDAVSTVVGTETLDVGGTAAQVLHVRYDVTFSGGNEGTQQMEWWLHLDTGLPLKMTRDLQVTSNSPFGKVDYREQFTSTALSLTPRR